MRKDPDFYSWHHLQHDQLKHDLFSGTVARQCSSSIRLLRRKHSQQLTTTDVRRVYLSVGTGAVGRICWRTDQQYLRANPSVVQYNGTHFIGSQLKGKTVECEIEVWQGFTTR